MLSVFSLTPTLEPILNTDDVGDVLLNVSDLVSSALVPSKYKFLVQPILSCPEIQPLAVVLFFICKGKVTYNHNLGYILMRLPTCTPLYRTVQSWLGSYI